MANLYDKNTRVNVDGEFTDEDTGAYLDPTKVQVKIKDPDGASTTYVYGVDAAVVKRAVGKYRIEVVGSKTGTYYYRWEGLDGSNVPLVAFESIFNVKTSAF